MDSLRNTTSHATLLPGTFQAEREVPVKLTVTAHTGRDQVRRLQYSGTYKGYKVVVVNKSPNDHPGMVDETWLVRIERAAPGNYVVFGTALRKTVNKDNTPAPQRFMSITIAKAILDKAYKYTLADRSCGEEVRWTTEKFGSGYVIAWGYFERSADTVTITVQHGYLTTTFRGHEARNLKDHGHYGGYLDTDE